ncbi:MAG: toll/interleukin-1 receptor domain-containing protein [Bacteroidota bacterium]
MAIISGFDNDIFISYAHKDNSAVSQEWVKQFYIYLKDMLIRSTGKSDIGIWWDDKKMDGNTYFEQSIEKGLEKTAIMISLHSPSYVASEWCLRELNHFSEHINNDGIGAMVGDDARIVHVLLYNMDREDWPAAFAGRSGIPLFGADDEDDLGDPLAINSDGFHEQMKKLRNALLRLIKGFGKLETSGATASNNSEEKETGKETIFFGDIPDSMGDRPRRIITELKEKGFHVISDIPLGDAPTHESEVKEAISQSALTIHFLDKYPGKSIPDEPGNWYRKKEVSLALGSDASQLIWMTSDFEFDDVEEEAYRDFLIELEQGKLVDKKYDFVRSVKGNVIKEVVGLADRLHEAAPVQKLSNGSINVLIDNHANDLAFAFELNNLFTEHKITTFLTPMEDDPKNNNEKLRNYISKSRKFIFIYGEVKMDWLNARLTTALKILLDYGLSARDMIVYMTPPEKGANTIKLRTQGIPIQVIDSSKDPEEQKAKMLELLTKVTSNDA